ncbi:MAG: hypothetical protein IJU25_02215 [Lachnospiraceae bacterium]|nr:hypothetical protein [Lachnospiraceae bacterium]
MNQEIKMSVSSMTRSGEKKGVYVLFQDGEKTAELLVPGCEVISNHGFDEAELAQLKEYGLKEQDAIFSLAKGVNPIKAFLSEPVKQ